MKLTLPRRGRICLNPLSGPGRTRRFPHRLRLESVQNPSLQHLRRILPVVPARIMSRLEAACYFALVTKSLRSAPRVRLRLNPIQPNPTENAGVFAPGLPRLDLLVPRYSGEFLTWPVLIRGICSWPVHLPQLPLLFQY